MRRMSKLLMAQVAFALVLTVALFALGAEIFVGHMNPDVILPWAYVAAVGWFGAWVCAILRLNIWFKNRKKDSP